MNEIRDLVSENGVIGEFNYLFEHELLYAQDVRLVGGQAIERSGRGGQVHVQLVGVDFCVVRMKQW